MIGYVYILKSLKTDKYYIGSSADYKKRYIQHNSGNVHSTKNNRPYKLLLAQKYTDIKLARNVERTIKKWKRKDFIDKIIEDKMIKITGH